MVASAGMALDPLLSKTFGQSAGQSGQAMPLSNMDELLEKGFLQPPPSARPYTYWMWMNGNITKKGITLDLEAMKQSGVGGAMIFNNAVGIPRGPVDFNSPQWSDMVLHAAGEANWLGLELYMHNSPGYSGAGGPWITPEMSMQELVWSESLAAGGGTIDVRLPKPYAKRGYYRDAFVLAYPSLPVEHAVMEDTVQKITINGSEVDKNILLDKNPETKIRLDPAADKPAVMLIEFSKPFEARAISIIRKADEPPNRFHGPKDYVRTLELEASDDGTQFRKVCTITMPILRQMDAPGSQSFPAVKAKYFRLTTKQPTWICGVALHAEPRLQGWPGKANFCAPAGDDSASKQQIEPELIINPDQVVDLSDKMDSDGRLKWDAPAGPWTILRIGHTTTGEDVYAVPDSIAGLECDNFTKESVDLHFNAFIKPLLKKLGPLVGKSFTGITIDSWEAGKQNWTKNFPEEFKNRSKYDIQSYLPAMTGRIVGSVEKSNQFLFDVRRVQADLLAENYYRRFHELCKNNGMLFTAEPYGDAIFESLQITEELDIPMAEFWAHRPGDVRAFLAPSAAHTFGKPIAAAEAFTGAPENTRWTETPYNLKTEGDWVFTAGINRLVFHTTVHQPYTTGLPGMTMGPFGTHFDRNSTWNRQASAWISYIKRTQYLLQQGLFVADICYFKGENPSSGVPNVSTMLPAGYAADVANRDVILDRMTIKDGRIFLPDGMNYGLLALPRLNNITRPLLQKIRDLVANGMTLVVQNKPDASASLSVTDAEVKTLADELWGDLDGAKVTQRNYGKGRIVWVKTINEIPNRLQIKPDFDFSAANKNAAVRYVHKRAGDADIFFVANGQRRDEDLVCDFRLDGRQPEIWNPETGEISPAAMYEFKDGRTHIPLHLDPAGSIFVVFRHPPHGQPYLSISRDGVKLIDAVKPLAEPQSPAPPQLQCDANGKIEALIWRDGNYKFQNAEKSASLKAENACRAIPISGTWKVQFPKGLGAPDEIDLDALESLSKNSEFGVRHFSGTMTYIKTFPLDKNSVDGQKVFLDLGSVEVIAQVNLNGQDLGILWKAPFRIDITNALKNGDNELKIKVTNLWPNRLIGDEYSPAEDEYTDLGAIVKLPEWFVKDLPRPGPRIAFSTWKHYSKNDPLPESGLIGPVKLFTAVQRIVE
ncbi:MAG: glycosyl hydrolase [Thermoguttaceae bacterium]